MRRIHIVGRKNSGKTTLVTELVRYFSERGRRVGTIKHTHHHHELDTPGKDSHLHREAGACAVGVLSRKLTAVFRPVDPDEPTADRYTALAPSFHDCDFVLVEGDLQTEAVKIEVWRAAVGNEPLALTHQSIRAVVTDDDAELPPVPVPVWRRSDIEALAQQIDRLLEAPRTEHP